RGHRVRADELGPRFSRSSAARRPGSLADDWIAGWSAARAAATGDRSRRHAANGRRARPGPAHRRDPRRAGRRPPHGRPMATGARDLMATKQGWTGRVFEDFAIGDVYEHPLGRTLLAADNVWFTCLTMNTNPIHFDAAYAAQTEFGKPLMNSCFTLAL